MFLIRTSSNCAQHDMNVRLVYLSDFRHIMFSYFGEESNLILINIDLNLIPQSTYDWEYQVPFDLYGYKVELVILRTPYPSRLPCGISTILYAINVYFV